ncbi:MAG TPA: hypothetical protein VIM69_10320 [Opitutaceae bacterium]
MAELTLHFEAAPGTDLNAAALELQRAIVRVNGVEAADAKPQRFQSIDAQEVLTVVQLATSYLKNTAEFLGAISAVYEAWKKLREAFPGLHMPHVEVGLKQVPIDQVTSAHVDQIIREQ